jgi:hypothetical protein
VKKTKKAIISTALTVLLLSVMLPTLLINNAKASDRGDISGVEVKSYGAHWWKIKTDLITVLFPASGRTRCFSGGTRMTQTTFML